MNNIERRSVQSLGKFAIRKKANGSHTISGRVAYNSESEPLPFIEIMVPGCFTKSLRSGQEVQCYYNHNSSDILARQSNGSLRLKDTSTALMWEADLNMDMTLGRDTFVAYRDGLLDANSYGFYVPEGGDTWYMRGNDIVREVHKAVILEVSPTPAPAYKANVSKLLRNDSISSDVRDALLRDDPQEDDDIDVCQHSYDERSGVTCSTCSQPVVDRDCRCETESLRDWTCNDCGLNVDDDDSDPADDTPDVDELDEGQRALVASLLLRAAE